MQYSEHFGFPLPEPDDYYNVENYRSTVERLDRMLLVTTELTEEAYKALPAPNPHTLYQVQNGGSVKLYLGTIPLGGGAVNAGAVALHLVGVSGGAGGFEIRDEEAEE